MTQRLVTTPEILTGIYTPVYGGDALVRFFNKDPGAFGPLDPISAVKGEQAIALMDSLPLLRQGYFLRNSGTILMQIYSRVNNLQDEENTTEMTSDNNMLDAFGGQIPATFFTYKDGVGNIKKITMKEAVDQGLASYIFKYI